MTDPDLLAKKLAFIETCVSEIRRLSTLDRIGTDLREERFVVHTLQIPCDLTLLYSASVSLRSLSRVSLSYSERHHAQTDC